jgi:hypothetical protein
MFRRPRPCCGLSCGRLPNSSLPQPALDSPAYLVEAPDSLQLPSKVIDEGSCLLRSYSADQAAFLEQDLHAGHLQLTLHGRKLHGIFILERLHAQSHTWELGRLQHTPPQRLQAVA